jgi:PIN domain nuclease of toxin-antitoxin system
VLQNVSGWEISTKHRIGKLPEAGSIVAGLPGLLRQAKIQPLPISIDDALLAGSMKQKHRDPFDRIIIAQAQLRDILIMTNDSAFSSVDANVLW